MATYDLILDGTTPSRFDFDTAFNNGTADIINVYVTVGYDGRIANYTNISGSPDDTINLIFDPAYTPVSNVSILDAYITISGANTHYIELNGFNSEDGGGIFAGTINVSAGAPPAPCFTSGTLIKTQASNVPVEDLTTGDMVLTMDHGYQPIRWIGSSKRAATGHLAPILIRKGALGNDRDLRVSPQHRMLLQGWQAELLYGELEVLATAKSLVNDHTIIRVEGGEVEYFHILFDTHEIIYAEGAPSESFHPGEQGWKGLGQATRDEILTLFPELAEDNFEAYGPSVRTSLKHKEGQVLSQYMTKTTKE